MQGGEDTGKEGEVLIRRSILYKNKMEKLIIY